MGNDNVIGLLLGLAVFLFVAIGIFRSFYKEEGLRTVLLMSFFGGAFVSCVILLVYMFIFSFFYHAYAKYELMNSYPIVTAQDKQTLVKTAFSSREKLTNYYIAEISDNVYKQEKAPAKYSVIKEHNSKTARVNIYMKRPTKGTWVRRESDIFCPAWLRNGEKKWEFVVPKGSVENKIKFDVK